MAISNKLRWIYVAEISLRCEQRQRGAPSSFPLDHLFELLLHRENQGTQKKLIGRNDEKMMWCTDVDRTNSTIRFLLHFGDKDVSDPAFVNFDTTDTREIPKGENEGVPFSSHIAIRSTPEANGNYMVLVERTSGIHLKSLENYLRWLLKDDNFKIQFENEDRQQRTAYGVVELLGYKSKLMRDVLRTGSLQDVEFVKEEEYHIGTDENPIRSEQLLSAKFKLQRTVTEQEGRSLFNRLTTWAQTNGYEEGAKMLVRIKTEFGQVKQTEVDPDGDILTSFFVANEQVAGFDDPLPQFYGTPRSDMFQKIESIFQQYQQQPAA
ncbi:hypothetical protein KUV39_11435 [Phaeobacter italicus]|uniref:hypothetical protein n=1 Tax=Phaeobacter italicus TaxID=481446 RepID=UPI001C964139|nr:hypothetical protein [Phaeobacter italicus]MBY5977257.1 hypothetical protein [Phaeobacter italicus]